MPSAREELLRLYADHNALEGAISLMNWDRQVLMPPGGAAARTQQVGLLTARAHALLTSDEMLRALEDFEREAEPGSEDEAMANALRREVDIETKLPAELVARKSSVSSDAYEAWKLAKAENRFDLLAPYLKQLFEIAGETAERLGYKDHVYDALLDLYEEGAGYADASKMFEEIKAPIVDLVSQIREQGRPVDDAPLTGNWDPARLRNVAQKMATEIGFDFNRGLLNVAPNAFCSGNTSSDVRMTTRASNHIKGILSSSLHEMGHGLYEQGSPAKWDRTPLSGGTSLAVHESQSRLWENIVGRARGFWRHFLPTLQAEFSEFDALDAEQFYRAFSKVEPTFIRVGADELTYNLHILVRFELEVEIISGKTAIRDLPEAWNGKYESYLGIVPETDSIGCLQDVHWSRGSVGYFPTYAMGNLIGGQIWQRLCEDIPNTQELMEEGRFAPILGWLTDKIYSKAKTMKPRDLVVEVTGEPMNAKAWLAYAQAKYKDIYALD